MSSFTVTSSDSTPATFQQANHNSTSSNSSSDSHKGTRPFQVNANAQPWTPQGHVVQPAQQQLPLPARHQGAMGFSGRPQPFMPTQGMNFPTQVPSVPSPTAAPAAAPKFSLCPTFLEHGFCDGRSCLHAHTFEDLHPMAQSNLLLMLNMSNSQLLSGHYAAQQLPGMPTTTTGALVGSNLHAHLANPAAYQQALAQQLMEDDSSTHGPSTRRQPQHLGGRKPDAGLALNKAHLASHTASTGGTSSHNTSYASTGANAMPCPPSPESHSDISSVSSGSGGRAVDPVQPSNGVAAAALQSTVASATLNDSQGSVTLPHSGPESPSSPSSAANGTSAISRYGVQPSPFIKSQMYYSQSASRVTLPDRCRYPHATPGSYYDYLNVKRSATKEDICAKYKQWRDEGYRKACALDAEKADAMDRLIVDAKNILSSDTMRVAYDALLPPLGAGLFGAVTSPMKPAASALPSSSSLLKPVVAPSSDSIW